MPYCTAKGCTNKSSSKSKAQLKFEKSKKITFHCFPKNIDKQKVWIDRMGLTKAALPKYPYLCSCHFSNESFDRTSACKIRLRDNALPIASKVHDQPKIATSQNAVVVQEINSVTIKLEHFTENEDFTANEVKVSMTDIQNLYNVNTVEETTKSKRSRTDEVLTVNAVEENTRIKQEIVNSQEDYHTKDASTETQRQPQSVDKSTMVCRSLLADSPTNIYLRDVIKSQKVAYERKIKLFKQTIRRKDKRIALLKNLLPQCKKNKRNMGTSTKGLLKQSTKKV